MAFNRNRTLQGNWKNSAADIEVDCAPEDEIDGCMPSNICLPASGFVGYKPKNIPEMMGRGFSVQPSLGMKDSNLEPRVKLSSGVNTFSGLQRMHRGADIKEDRYDSCYDSGVLDSEENDNCVYSESSETPVLSSNSNRIQEVGKQFEELTITHHTKSENIDFLPQDDMKHKYSEETCASVDEAYYSEERTNSERLPSLKDDQTICDQIFCEQNKEGDTHPHLCLIHGKIYSFLQLLSAVRNPAHLNIQNLMLQTLLHLAVILNLPQIVRKLVAWGADVDRRDRNGNTPLHVASEKGYFECVLALTTPLDPREVKDVPYTPAYQRIPQDQDIKNYDGMTCLHLAVHNQHIKIVNHLITKCYADINVQEGRAGETVLHQAVKDDNKDIIEYLLLHRELNIEATRYDGSTAIQLAQGLRNGKLINLLLNAGADFSSDQIEEDGDNSGDEDMRDCDADDEFTYDDFRIGGNLVSM